MKIQDKLSDKIRSVVFSVTIDTSESSEIFNVVDFEDNQVIDFDTNTIVGEG